MLALFFILLVSGGLPPFVVVLKSAGSKREIHTSQSGLPNIN